MRLGGPVFTTVTDPELLAKAHLDLGYRAAYCPGFLSLDDLPAIRKVSDAFESAGVLIAEVGAWSNPLDPNTETAAKAKEHMKRQLALADEVGAACCVNILGSHSPTNWDGPHPDGYGSYFFDRCVATAREVIDAVKPKRTKLTFEMMPFYFLDCADEYLRLLAAIDRPAAGIHLDLCNCVASPRIFYNTAVLINDAFDKLGENILSIHAKDIMIRSGVCTAQFEEVLIGTGGMDYGTLLRRAASLKRDVPLMLEHLPGEADYTAAANALEVKASSMGLQF